MSPFGTWRCVFVNAAWQVQMAANPWNSAAFAPARCITGLQLLYKSAMYFGATCRTNISSGFQIFAVGSATQWAECPSPA